MRTLAKKMMKAVMLEEFHKEMVITELPIPAPKKNEVLVKIMSSGLCATDLHIQEGIIPTIKVPYIPGHEGAGIVEEVGLEVTDVHVGQHVVIGVDILCGKCRYCLIGRGNLCLSRVRIGFERNGTHAQYCVVPQEVLFPIDKSVPFDQACVIPDAVVCMYHAIRNQGKVTPGQKICLLGIGGLGFQGIQIAKYFGAEIISISRQDKKLEIARELGSHHTVNTAKNDLFESVNRITDGELCDVVFDIIGSDTSVEECVKICKPGGKIILMSYSVPSFTAPFQDIVIKEKELIGIRGSTRQDIVEAVKLVQKGIVKPLIYQSFPLKEVNRALQQLAQGGSLSRTVINPWQE